MARSLRLGFSAFCLLAAAPSFAQMALGPEGPSGPPPSAAPYSLRDGSAASDYLEQKLSAFSNFLDADDALGGVESLRSQFSNESNLAKKAVLRDLIEVLREPLNDGRERLAARGLRSNSAIALAIEVTRHRIVLARAAHPALDSALKDAIPPEAVPAPLPEHVLEEAAALSRRKRDDLVVQVQEARRLSEKVWRSPRSFDANSKLLPYLVAAVRRIPPDLQPTPTPKLLAAALNRIGLAVRSLAAEKSPLLTPVAVRELKKAFALHPLLAPAKLALERYESAAPAPAFHFPKRVPDTLHDWRDFFDWGGSVSATAAVVLLLALTALAGWVAPALGAASLASLPLALLVIARDYRNALRQARKARRDALIAEADEELAEWLASEGEPGP